MSVLVSRAHPPAKLHARDACARQITRMYRKLSLRRPWIRAARLFLLAAPIPPATSSPDPSRLACRPAHTIRAHAHESPLPEPALMPRHSFRQQRELVHILPSLVSFRGNLTL